MANPQPSLFISHGSPMMSLEPGPTAPFLQALGPALARPDAIVVASAHWETDLPMVTGTNRPETIHDFYGFPEALYKLLYPAPGSPALAEDILSLLNDAGFKAAIDPRRGLDHGAWVPARLMFPAADIPTLQVSIQPDRDAAYHVRLGQALAPLRERNILVIGSGAITHNLRELDRSAIDAPPAPFAARFDGWMRERVAEGDLDALLDYRARAPEAVRNHPTDEHLMPFYVALGAGMAADTAFPAHRLLHTATTYGALAMTAFAFGAA